MEDLISQRDSDMVQEEVAADGMYAVQQDTQSVLMSEFFQHLR